jgi:hypothetical protein
MPWHGMGHVTWRAHPGLAALSAYHPVACQAKVGERSAVIRSELERNANLSPPTSIWLKGICSPTKTKVD